MFDLPRGPQRRRFSRTAGRLLNFTVIGAICTILFAVLYDLFRTMATPVEANIAALSVTMPLNFAANRWLTFEGGSRSLWSEALQYGAVYLFGLACSSLVLAAAAPFDPKLVKASKGKLQVAFLGGPPRRRARDEALAMGTDEDRLAFGKRELYWLPSGGTRDSAFDAKAVEKLLGPITMRTKGTIEQLAAKYFAH